MPLPIVLGVAAGIFAVGGIGSGIHGAIKMKEANDTMDVAKWKQDKAIRTFKLANESATEMMDSLGTTELKILREFSEFQDVLEKIQGRPVFDNVKVSGVKIPEYNAKEIQSVSIGAGVLLGGLGGAALGTAGGFAAAGATTAAVMALGTASTGTAIATLSGVAATNATLAALGGGAIAAGGGGVALGTTILGATTLGASLLVGGIIFNIVGSSLSDKADKAYEQAKKTEKEVDKTCNYLNKMERYARSYKKTLTSVESKYKDYLWKLKNIVEIQGKTEWVEFTEEERITRQLSRATPARSSA